MGYLYRRWGLINRFFARQLGKPDRLFSHILAPVWNRRNAALNDTAFKILDLLPDDRVLEVGFGGGYLLKRIVPVLIDGYLAGIDISQAMVARNVKRFRRLIDAGKLDLRWARADIIPYPAEDFTKACSVNSIFYWEDASQVLTELWRVLKPNGLIILCQTCLRSLENRGFSSHISRFEDSDLRRMLEVVGFQEIQTTHASDKYREYTCLKGKKLISV